jgi:hypothetical protein
MTMTELADYADVPLRLAVKAVGAMVDLGMVVMDGEVMTAPKFTTRQYESDDVTARTRRHRKERSNDVPSENVGTFQRGSQERSRNGRRNAPETETETETEKNLSAEADRPPTSTTDPRFVEFWNVYPRHVGKPDALRALGKALKRADLPTIVAGARRYAADPNREEQFTPHPATWLNREGWADDPLPPRLGPRPQEDASRARIAARQANPLASAL